MAEIRVERKRRPLLPYLLALLALVALLWWFLSRGDTPAVAATAADTATVATGVESTSTGAAAANTTADSAGGAVAAPTAAGTGNTAVDDFIAFVAPNTVERNEDEQHRFTADALRRLATALESMRPGGAATAQLALVRQKADSLQSTAVGNDRHTEMARAAFESADEVMGALPASGRIGDELAAARRAARAVNPAEQLLAQRGRVQSYFDAAATALRAAARGT